jgi:ABC-2 type transport system ATP-binding protein
VTESAPRVEVHALGKTFLPMPGWARAFTRSPVAEPVRALDGVSLTVVAGEVCAVAGRNGAGKSTLFRILTGLVSPTEGRARVCGYDATADGHEVRRRIGFVPGDERSLFLHHTPRENLTFRGRLHGLPNTALRRRIEEVLDLVDLGEQGDRVGFALSSGMRARLQLACALLHEPAVLVLDEPTASIDPVASYALLETIRGLAREQQLAVLLSTHRADEIEALAANVALLDRGRLLHVGHLDQLRARYESPTVALTFDRPAAAGAAASRVRSLAGVEVVGVRDTTLTLATSLTTGQILASLDGGLAAVDSVQRGRLPVRDLLARVLRSDDATGWDG